MAISDADNAAISEIGQTCISDAWLAGRCGRRCWRGRNQLVSQADSERSRRPHSQSHGLEHHAGRHVALPTRTLATTPASSARRLRRHSRFSPPHDRAQPCRGDFVTV